MLPSTVLLYVFFFFTSRVFNLDIISTVLGYCIVHLNDLSQEVTNIGYYYAVKDKVS